MPLPVIALAVTAVGLQALSFTSATELYLASPYRVNLRWMSGAWATVLEVATASNLPQRRTARRTDFIQLRRWADKTANTDQSALKYQRQLLAEARCANVSRCTHPIMLTWCVS